MITVERIDQIIDGGFENLEVAIVAGESTVVGKGEFKEGDLCVFFRAGILLPANSVRSPYLEKFVTVVNKKTNLRAYRIKTRKFGNIPSNGIAFTLPQFYYMIKKSGIGRFFTSKEQVINRRSYRAQLHDDLTNVIGAFSYNPKGRYLSSQYFA